MEKPERLDDFCSIMNEARSAKDGGDYYQAHELFSEAYKIRFEDYLKICLKISRRSAEGFGQYSSETKGEQRDRLNDYQAEINYLLREREQAINLLDKIGTLIDGSWEAILCSRYKQNLSCKGHGQEDDEEGRENGIDIMGYDGWL